jgi:hypothetical protein
LAHHLMAPPLLGMYLLPRIVGSILPAGPCAISLLHEGPGSFASGSAFALISAQGGVHLPAVQGVLLQQEPRLRRPHPRPALHRDVPLPSLHLGVLWRRAYHILMHTFLSYLVLHTLFPQAGAVGCAPSQNPLHRRRRCCCTIRPPPVWSLLPSLQCPHHLRCRGLLRRTSCFLLCLFVSPIHVGILSLGYPLQCMGNHPSWSPRRPQPSPSCFLQPPLQPPC